MVTAEDYAVSLLQHSWDATPVWQVALTMVGDETRSRRPLSRADFAGLSNGQHVQDRHDRVWTVVAQSYEQHRERRVNLRSGDLVRIERDRFSDDYVLIEVSDLRVAIGVE